MHKTLSSSITAVIAAGGYATRLGGGLPKSLWKVASRSLLEHSAAAVAQAGINSFVVFNNRPEFNTTIRMAVEPYGALNLINDQGVASTFLLAKQTALITHHQYICFMYGHAPRPGLHLLKLIEMVQKTVVVTAVESTTKRFPIPLQLGYLEPPYIIPTIMLRETYCIDWKAFFTEPVFNLTIVKALGPGEANSLPEIISYANYFNKFSRLCTV